nr:MAG TPA: hypothetical protein [Caudoviricetes sp.]
MCVYLCVLGERLCALFKQITRRCICIIKILYYLCSEGLTNRLN